VRFLRLLSHELRKKDGAVQLGVALTLRVLVHRIHLRIHVASMRLRRERNAWASEQRRSA